MDTYHILKEEHLVPSDAAGKAAILSSRSTGAVASAVACGIRLLGFFRQVESTKDGPRERVTWQLESRNISFGSESIPLAEFFRRYDDSKWCAENPEHPIAYMAAKDYVMRRLTEVIRASEPLITITRGNSVINLVRNGDRQRQSALLSRAGFSGSEIDSILNSLQK